MASKKVFITGIGWCYEVTVELKNKLENNVTGDEKVRTFNQTKQLK